MGARIYTILPLASHWHGLKSLSWTLLLHLLGWPPWNSKKGRYSPFCTWSCVLQNKSLTLEVPCPKSHSPAHLKSAIFLLSEISHTVKTLKLNWIGAGVIPLFIFQSPKNHGKRGFWQCLRNSTQWLRVQSSVNHSPAFPWLGLYPVLPYHCLSGFKEIEIHMLNILHERLRWVLPKFTSEIRESIEKLEMFVMEIYFTHVDLPSSTWKWKRCAFPL